jgi:dTDP-4-amino-4,6-dideoxygalactose transaminase
MARPQADPARRFARQSEEIMAAIAEVFARGRFVLGPAVASFEQAFAEYLGVAQCVGVNSGTDALALALRAAGIGPGDEVIVPSLTAAGTAAAVVQAGAVPVLVDVDAQTRHLDSACVRAAIGPATAAIVVVHLHGIPADMDLWSALAARHGLFLLEDCAQAHGAEWRGRKVGSFGDAAAFSFYPTKNLGAPGDGGAIVTRDATLASHLHALRNHGWRDAARISEAPGGNSRLDEIQAAVLSVLLPHLDADNAARRVLAKAYRRALSDSACALPPEVAGSVYHQFAVTLEERDSARAWLLEHAAQETAVHYATPLHLQPAFAHHARGQMSVSETLARGLLSLPIQPEITDSSVVSAVAEALFRYQDGDIRPKGPANPLA